jgi:hypothetical protein
MVPPLQLDIRDPPLTPQPHRTGREATPAAQNASAVTRQPGPLQFHTLLCVGLTSNTRRRDGRQRDLSPQVPPVLLPQLAGNSGQQPDTAVIWSGL